MAWFFSIRPLCSDERALPEVPNHERPPGTRTIKRDAIIPADERRVRGLLVLPPGASSVVVFAHGQRERPVQPAQPVCRPGAPAVPPGNAADRPAGRRRGQRPRARLRHRAARPTGSTPPPSGCRPSARRADFRLGYFGASTGAGRPWWRPPGRPAPSRPSSHAAAGPTWPAIGCPTSRRPRC